MSRTQCPRAAVGEGRCVRSRAGPARLRAYIPMILFVLLVLAGNRQSRDKNLSVYGEYDV